MHTLKEAKKVKRQGKLQRIRVVFEDTALPEAERAGQDKVMNYGFQPSKPDLSSIALQAEEAIFATMVASERDNWVAHFAGTGVPAEVESNL